MLGWIYLSCYHEPNLLLRRHYKANFQLFDYHYSFELHTSYCLLRVRNVLCISDLTVL